jgi:hypothetical protein
MKSRGTWRLLHQTFSSILLRVGAEIARLVRQNGRAVWEGDRLSAGGTDLSLFHSAQTNEYRR